jgi:hypothetical protein
MGHQASRLAEQ